MGASDPGHSVPDPLPIEAEEVIPLERVGRTQMAADGRSEQDGCPTSEHRHRTAVPPQSAESGAARLRDALRLRATVASGEALWDGVEKNGKTPAVGRRPIVRV